VAVPPRSGIAPEPDSGDLLLVAAGDDAALRRILSRWRQPVYAVFERLREPSAAAEATIQTFERLVRSARRFDPGESFPATLWGHAARVMQEQPPAEPVAVSGARLAESASARTALQRSAIATLPPGERAAFLLTRVAHLPLSTARAALGIGEPELRRRLVRALESLRGSLRPLLGAQAPGEVPPEEIRVTGPDSGDGP
jgi:RNA polymerase sigma-70 factor (ECF subfamily)